MYAKIPFGLMNAGATFHREMGIDFIEEKYNFVVIYMDDIIVYSKSDTDHIKHLEKGILEMQEVWYFSQS